MYFFIHILFLIYIERKNSVNQKLYTTCIKSLWRYFVLPRVFGYQHNFCNTALKGHQGGCPAHPGFTGDTALKGASPPCEFMPWVEDHNSHLASIKATYSREKGEVLKKKKKGKDNHEECRKLDLWRRWFEENLSHPCECRTEGSSRKCQHTAEGASQLQQIHIILYLSK